MVGQKLFFDELINYLDLQSNFGHALVAQLNRASDYGSEGSGFESLQVHKSRQSHDCRDFLLIKVIYNGD